jgi:uncharacterized membrane-anchored protein
MTTASSSPSSSPSSNPSSPEPRARSHWQFWLPLAVQVFLILLLPLRSAQTYYTGETAILQTAPVDPYDLMRGYYVTLSYEISQPQTIEELPGWDQVLSPEAEEESTYYEPSLFADKPTNPVFYVVLEAPAGETSTPPEPWTPVRVSPALPENLPENQIAIRGRFNRWQANYGLESYYIPEDQRLEINSAIAEIQRRNGTDQFVVAVRVNSQGEAVPTSLWVGNKNYRF